MTLEDLKATDPGWLEAYRRQASYLFHQWLEGHPEDLILLVAAARWAAAAEDDTARVIAQTFLREELPPEWYTRRPS